MEIHRKRTIDNSFNLHLFLLSTRKYPTLDGSRYFWDARYVTVTFEGSPKCLEQVNRFLKTEDLVLREFAIKAKSSLQLSRMMTYKNPYANV